MRRILFAALLSLATVAPASAELRIEGSAGGVIGDYLRLFALAKQLGHNVVIDGPCLSACTLVLAVVPRERVCVTSRAVLGFHAAWLPDEAGRPVISPGGTRVLFAIYPAQIRSWIKRNGGLSGRPIFMRGPALNSFYRTCA